MREAYTIISERSFTINIYMLITQTNRAQGIIQRNELFP